VFLPLCSSIGGVDEALGGGAIGAVVDEKTKDSACHDVEVEQHR